MRLAAPRKLSALPELPETKVVGEPEAAAPVPPTPDEGPSILEGSVFASPRAAGYEANSSTAGTVDRRAEPGCAHVDRCRYEGLQKRPAGGANDEVLRRHRRRGQGERPAVSGRLFFLRGSRFGRAIIGRNGFLGPNRLRRGTSPTSSGSTCSKGRPPYSTARGSLRHGQRDHQEALDEAGYCGGVQVGKLFWATALHDRRHRPDQRRQVACCIASTPPTRRRQLPRLGFVERTFAAPAMTWVLDPTPPWPGRANYVQ